MKTTLNEMINCLEYLEYYIEQSNEGLLFKQYAGYCENTYYVNKTNGTVYLDNPEGKIYFDNYSDTLEFINGNINIGKRQSSNYNRY
tara:strand:- start:218 stop:478 length:261 start_codon:yes stop_codon:yes gene_type:complete